MSSFALGLSDDVAKVECHAALPRDWASLRVHSMCRGVLYFIHRLDEHYGWRYYDDISKRSKSKSPTELHPIDILFIKLYECYMDFLPVEHKPRTYLFCYLFAPEIRENTSWSYWLLTDNRALKSRVANWEKKFMEWHTEKSDA
jgi:hypothetical protein